MEVDPDEIRGHVGAAVTIRSTAPPHTEIDTFRRAALWTLLAAKLWGGWGVSWDFQWHVLIGRDSPWIPPHLMTYSAVVAAVAISLGALGRETCLARAGRLVPNSFRILGLVGTRGMHLAWWGTALAVLSAPVDDAWHRLFGLDPTVWSPPHLLGLLGVQVNAAGCLLLAIEAYPADSRARLFALVSAGTAFFGGFHILLGSSIVWAYDPAGLGFFGYPILAALFLPVALVPVARLSAVRWAPVLAVALGVVTAVAGAGVSKLGFALVKPESQIPEFIAREPDSSIAKKYQMARESGTEVWTFMRGARLVTWALLPALALSLLEARRRTILGGLAFAAIYLAVAGWSFAQLPAIQPRLPTAFETIAGVALALLAGAVGALVGRVCADRFAWALGEVESPGPRRPAPAGHA